jgi:uncharacterized Zn finger protein
MKHSKQERDRSMKQFRDKYAKLKQQYLIQYEGTKDDYENDECDRDIVS